MKYSKWRSDNGLHKITRRLSPLIYSEDIPILKQWRQSNDRRKWERAIILFKADEGMPLKKIALAIDRSFDVVKDWMGYYKKNRLSPRVRISRKINEEIKDNLKRKKSNLIKLIHEPPAIHGINRSSWTIKSLASAYTKDYNQFISRSTVSEYLRSEGFSFKQAKKVLTSPDPMYREKLQNITNILSNLGEKEKFFSIDEYGPFAIKIQGGRSLTSKDEIRTYPQYQKSKGFLICTAALELSTNQVSHFYSLKKNTEEMIKLLEILLVQYSNEKKLFFSWDSASWHASKELNKKVTDVNSKNYRKKHKSPLVELAPLPSSAQFLNVIESVFSGLAKAIIHNSNYPSVEKCKSAIDLYFAERNKYFLENPKRAGNKIWGKEIVKPIFDEGQNCKDPKCR